MLTRFRCSASVFAELPKSAAAAAEHYATREEDSERRLFWSQFQAPKHPPLLNNQMKQLMEMHRMAEPALKDLCVRLWPAEPIPDSYFGLVQRLRDASPRIDTVKWFACLEGARLSFAKTMVHWPKIKTMDMATGPPPVGKEHHKPELYFA